MEKKEKKISEITENQNTNNRRNPFINISNYKSEASFNQMESIQLSFNSNLNINNTNNINRNDNNNILNNNDFSFILKSLDEVNNNLSKNISSYSDKDLNLIQSTHVKKNSNQKIEDSKEKTISPIKNVENSNFFLISSNKKKNNNIIENKAKDKNEKKTKKYMFNNKTFCLRKYYLDKKLTPIKNNQSKIYKKCHSHQNLGVDTLYYKINDIKNILHIKRPIKISEFNYKGRNLLEDFQKTNNNKNIFDYNTINNNKLKSQNKINIEKINLNKKNKNSKIKKNININDNNNHKTKKIIQQKTDSNIKKSYKNNIFKIINKNNIKKSNYSNKIHKIRSNLNHKKNTVSSLFEFTKSKTKEISSNNFDKMVSKNNSNKKSLLSKILYSFNNINFKQNKMKYLGNQKNCKNINNKIKNEKNKYDDLKGFANSKKKNLVFNNIKKRIKSLSQQNFGEEYIKKKLISNLKKNKSKNSFKNYNPFKTDLESPKNKKPICYSNKTYRNFGRKSPIKNKITKNNKQIINNITKKDALIKKNNIYIDSIFQVNSKRRTTSMNYIINNKFAKKKNNIIYEQKKNNNNLNHTIATNIKNKKLNLNINNYQKNTNLRVINDFNSYHKMNGNTCKYQKLKTEAKIFN